MIPYCKNRLAAQGKFDQLIETENINNFKIYKLAEILPLYIINTASMGAFKVKTGKQSS